MEILLLIGVAVIAVIMLAQPFKVHIRDPETLRDDDLEDAYIELKKKILIINGHKSEVTYEHLCDRISSVLSKIVMRHEHYILNTETKNDSTINIAALLVPVKNHDFSVSYAVRHRAPYDRLPDDELLYLCFFTYIGGLMKRKGYIVQNTEFTLEALDYLINHREYMPAVFLKGFILKYGVEVFKAPQLDEAHSLLEKAAANGIGSASHELRHFYKHLILKDIPSING